MTARYGDNPYDDIFDDVHLGLRVLIDDVKALKLISDDRGKPTVVDKMIKFLYSHGYVLIGNTFIQKDLQ